MLLLVHMFDYDHAGAKEEDLGGCAAASQNE